MSPEHTRRFRMDRNRCKPRAPVPSRESFGVIVANYREAAYRSLARLPFRATRTRGTKRNEAAVCPERGLRRPPSRTKMFAAAKNARGGACAEDERGVRREGHLKPQDSVTADDDPGSGTSGRPFLGIRIGECAHNVLRPRKISSRRTAKQKRASLGSDAARCPRESIIRQGT